MKQPSRHHGCFWLAILLALPLSTRAADTLHLLGFVKRLCPDEPYCFELRVEPGYIAQAGEQIRVRFNGETSIYDPENYELSLQQQNIIPGSHLRMLIAAEQNIGPDDYRASHIWIGD
jgi:hypothetical protein